MACMCGDSQCPSCGEAQQTLDSIPAFQRIVNPGRIYGEGEVYCLINWNGERLSISGVVGPTKSGDAQGGCGQILDSVRILPKMGEVYKSFPVIEFVKVWNRWHLNDMRPECEHQRNLGWKWTTHPSEPCPECGYRLGSQWLHENVPPEVLEWLQNLPETGKTPAWV